MKKVVLLFSLLVSCTIAFSQISFLDFGKSIPTDAREGLLISSYSFGSAGSSPAITVTLDASSSSMPDLFQATAIGTIFQKVELTTYVLGKVSSKITFTNVMIASISTSGDGTAFMTFTYGSMKTK
jgi:hypothetical protein